jgi:hypothetical protein
MTAILMQAANQAGGARTTPAPRGAAVVPAGRPLRWLADEIIEPVLAAAPVR